MRAAFAQCSVALRRPHHARAVHGWPYPTCRRRAGDRLFDRASKYVRSSKSAKYWQHGSAVQNGIHAIFQCSTIHVQRGLDYLERPVDIAIGMRVADHEGRSKHATAQQLLQEL